MNDNLNDFLDSFSNNTTCINFDKLKLSIEIRYEIYMPIIDKIKTIIEKKVEKYINKKIENSAESMSFYAFLNAPSLAFGEKIGPVYYEDIEEFMKDREFYFKFKKNDIVYLTPNYQFKTTRKDFDKYTVKYFVLTDKNFQQL